MQSYDMKTKEQNLEIHFEKYSVKLSCNINLHCEDLFTKKSAYSSRHQNICVLFALCASMWNEPQVRIRVLRLESQYAEL